MNKKLSELRQECINREIDLLNPSHYKKSNYIRLLQRHSLTKMDPSWGLLQRLKMDEPMLCFPFKHLREDQQENVFSDIYWGAEEKFNGCRMVITYHRDEGFKFFGRDLSVEDFLPIDYTEKVLLNHYGKLFLTGDSFVNVFNDSFVLDSEIIIEESYIDTSAQKGKAIYSSLNACVAVLNMKPEKSHTVQREQAQLFFKVFDLLSWFDQPVRSRAVLNQIENPLIQRKIALVELGKRLRAHFFTQMEFIPSRIREKEEFYKEIIAKGGEGIVIKSLVKPYIVNGTRNRHTQVKVKASMVEAANDDIDAYIIGYTESTEGKQWENFIGGIKLAVYLKKPNGEEEEHWIATVTGMPMHWRKAFTEINQGEPILKQKWYNAVFSINGQSITAENLRFIHATIDWNEECYRPDRSHLSCKMDQGFLISQIR